ncbi:MAG: hypothetical protein MHM6MM_004214 [Cercozoa sp. M6MM]
MAPPLGMVLQQTPDLQTLFNLLGSQGVGAELAPFVAKFGQIVVFAPDNNAFEKFGKLVLPSQLTLADVLRYHVAPISVGTLDDFVPQNGDPVFLSTLARIPCELLLPFPDDREDLKRKGLALLDDSASSEDYENYQYYGDAQYVCHAAVSADFARCRDRRQDEQWLELAQFTHPEDLVCATTAKRECFDLYAQQYVDEHLCGGCLDAAYKCPVTFCDPKVKYNDYLYPDEHPDDTNGDTEESEEYEEHDGDHGGDQEYPDDQGGHNDGTDGGHNDGHTDGHNDGYPPVTGPTPSNTPYPSTQAPSKMWPSPADGSDGKCAARIRLQRVSPGARLIVINGMPGMAQAEINVSDNELKVQEGLVLRVSSVLEMRLNATALMDGDGQSGNEQPAVRHDDNNSNSNANNNDDSNERDVQGPASSAQSLVLGASSLTLAVLANLLLSESL